MFIYCGNAPLLYIDLGGNKYIENHPIHIVNSTTFQVEYSDIFNDPGVCLFYAYEIIDEYGNGRELCGMDAERIAKEIYAHALGYTIGEIALSSSDSLNNPFLDDYYGFSEDQSAKASSALLRYCGDVLTISCGTIDVNKGDKFVFGYDIIWWYRMSGEYKAQIHLEYLAYKEQEHPHPHGGNNIQMPY